MRSTEFALSLTLLLTLCGGVQGAQKFSDAYIGSQMCQTCHEEVFNDILKSPHGAVEKGLAPGAKDNWKEHACESCHGPGAKHAGSADPSLILNPAKMPATQIDQICLGCHRSDHTMTSHISGTHAKQGISCVACHQVHAGGGHALTVRANQAVNAQCSACHQTAWASFQKPFGHRLTMNAMSCVDCHNPHGSVRTDASEPTCFQCHGDKRGPFTFEHAPVRLEGCGACHQPHGALNPRLLTRHEVRLVCLECHANQPGVNAKTAALGVVPASFHDLRSPRYQNCTVCHQSVHGSYTDRNLIR